MSYSMLGKLIFGLLLVLVIGYLILDYFMLKKGIDLTRRLKYFIIPIVVFPFGAFLLWFGIYEVIESIDLANNGIATIATVRESKVERSYRRKGVRIYYKHNLAYDGYEKICDLDKEYPIGTKFHFVYSAKNPDNAMVSRLKRSFAEYFFEKYDFWMIGLLIGMPLFCFGVGARFIYLLFQKESVLESAED